MYTTSFSLTRIILAYRIMVGRYQYLVVAIAVKLHQKLLQPLSQEQRKPVKERPERPHRRPEPF